MAVGKLHHSEVLWLAFTEAAKGVGAKAVQWPRHRYGQRNKLLKVVEESCPIAVRNLHPEAVRLYMSALLAIYLPTSTATLGGLAGLTRAKWRCETASRIASDGCQFLNGTPDAYLPAHSVGDRCGGCGQPLAPNDELCPVCVGSVAR